MATLYLRGVPEALYDELKQYAQADGQSLNTEALEVFTKGLQQRRVEVQRRQAMAELDALRRRIGPTLGDSLALLREDRER